MDTREAMGDAIDSALHESGELVTKWVTLLETIGPDGERGLHLLSSADTKPWDTLGLLTYAIQSHQARVVRARPL